HTRFSRDWSSDVCSSDLITDRMAHQIINTVMIPYFKENNFYGGLDAGSDAIFKALKGEYKETRKRSSKENEGIPVFVILFFIVRSEERRVGKECRCRWSQ